MIDIEVIQWCLEKREAGYKKLYEACFSYVYAIVRSYVTDDFYHKDLVQEIFAQTFLKIDKYDASKGEFKPWLRKVAVNICLMHLRKQKQMNLNDSIDSDKVREISDGIPLKTGLTRAEIESLLKDMPTGYKTVFLMIAIDDYTHEEVAEALGISNNASRSQYLRAKRYIENKIFTEVNLSKYGI